MKSDVFDFKELRKIPLFGIKKYKASYYMGEISKNENLRDGKGICVYENSRLFEGVWKNDKRQEGYEIFSNGNTYLGEYNDGKVSGRGLYVWTNHDTYNG